MERARDIRKQLEGVLKIVEIDLTSSNGDLVAINKAIVSGCTQTRLVCKIHDNHHYVLIFWVLFRILPQLGKDT